MQNYYSDEDMIQEMEKEVEKLKTRIGEYEELVSEILSAAYEHGFISHLDAIERFRCKLLPERTGKG